MDFNKIVNNVVKSFKPVGIRNTYRMYPKSFGIPDDQNPEIEYSKEVIDKFNEQNKLWNPIFYWFCFGVALLFGYVMIF